MLKEDIINAQKILELSKSNYKTEVFHDTSAIYKQSNEKISAYHKYLTGKDDVLSVIASADQIVNCILEGSKNIDAFDISCFPKYFLFLKLAAIKSLDKDQYIDFFLGDISTDEKYDDMYFDLMRENLEEESREFWDGLFNFYDWNEIYTSALFSNDPIANSYTIHENKYLKDDEFKKLKTLIDKVNIKTYNSDLKDLSQLVMKKYDLVYLSNICNYMNLLEYKKIMESLPLKENGEILTYFYKKQDHVLKYFDDENYTFDQFEKASSGVLVYKKIK